MFFIFIMGLYKSFTNIMSNKTPSSKINDMILKFYNLSLVTLNKKLILV